MTSVSSTIYVLSPQFDLTAYLATLARWTPGSSEPDPERPVHASLDCGYELVIFPRAPRPNSLLSGLGEPALADLIGTRCASAVLYCPRLTRSYAIPIGHGRHQLPPGAIDDAIYSLDALARHARANSVRGTRSRRVAPVPLRQTRTLDHRGSPAEAGLTSDDLVLGVEAVLDALGPSDLREDSVRVSHAPTPPDLERVFAALDTLLERPSVGVSGITLPGMRTVRPEVQAALNDLVLSGTVDARIDPPANNGPADGWFVHDRRLPIALADLVAPDDARPLTRDRLSRSKASCDVDGVLQLESVWALLSAEVERGDDLFVLTGGRWRRIPARERERIAAALNREKVDPPEGWHGILVGTVDEATWTRRAADRGGTVLDRKLFPVPGGHRLELADLCHPDLGLCHVKPYKSRTQSISHVFAQIRGAAEARRRLPEVDAWLAQSLGEEPPRVFTAVLLDRRKRAGGPLPYLAQLELHRTLEAVRALGYGAQWCLVGPALTRRAA